MPETSDAVATAVFLPPHDLHNHTIYCGHADQDATVANLITRARELKLDVLGISEHVIQPSDLVSLDRIREELLAAGADAYTTRFAVEMDIDPADADGHWVTPDVHCDFVILSAHGFPQFDLEIPASDRELEASQQRRNLALKWLAWYGKAIERGGFHVLGHPLREPLIMNIVDLNDDELVDLIIGGFKPAIDHGIAFELNDAFLGALSLSPSYEPYLAMTIRLKKMGMRFVRGSDSHGVIKVGASDAIAAFARDAGLTRSDWLDAMQFPRGLP